jgi:hypothetical protein
MEKTYGVYLTVPFTDVSEWFEINSIAKSVNSHECGSGTTVLGSPRYRDIDWEVVDLSSAEALERKLVSAFALYKGADVRIHSIPWREVK